MSKQKKRRAINFTDDEDTFLLEWFQKVGNKWSVISQEGKRLSKWVVQRTGPQLKKRVDYLKTRLPPRKNDKNDPISTKRTLASNEEESEEESFVQKKAKSIPEIDNIEDLISEFHKLFGYQEGVIKNPEQKDQHLNWIESAKKILPKQEKLFQELWLSKLQKVEALVYSNSHTKPSFENEIKSRKLQILEKIREEEDNEITGNVPPSKPKDIEEIENWRKEKKEEEKKKILEFKAHIEEIKREKSLYEEILQEWREEREAIRRENDEIREIRSQLLTLINLLLSNK